MDTPAEYVEHAIAYVESAKCSADELSSLWNEFRNTQDGAVEVFINQYYHKRAQKEIPASRNDPFKVDQTKVYIRMAGSQRQASSPCDFSQGISLDPKTSSQ